MTFKNFLSSFLIILSATAIAQHQLDQERLALDDFLQLPIFQIKDNLSIDGQKFIDNNQEFTLNEVTI